MQHFKRPKNSADMIFRNLFNKNADQLAKEAIQDYQKGKDEFLVIEKLQKALNIGIKNYPLDHIYLHIGASYFDLALYEKAKEAYEKGLEYNSKNHSLLSNIGLSLQKLGALEKAIPYYKASLEIKPDHSYAYHNIGLYLYETGRHFEAIENLDNAIKYNPGLVVSYSVKARCLAYLGNYKEADKVLKEAIKRGFDNGQIVKNELEEIKNGNPLVFYDSSKFEKLLAELKMSSNQIELIFQAKQRAIEFFNNNIELFNDKSFSSFDINNSLHWYLLVQMLQKDGRLFSINENTGSKELITEISKILSAGGFAINDTLVEFELYDSYDVDSILSSIASKLKLVHSIELINIWLSDYELNIIPISKDSWESLDYPFINNANGIGKIYPIASNQTIETWLIKDIE